MKKMSLLALLMVNSLWGSAPPVSDIEHSAGPATPESEAAYFAAKSRAKAVVSPPRAVGRIIPVFLPEKNSSSWIPAADMVIAAAIGNSIGTNGAITAPTNYAVGRQFTWQNTVYSQSAPMWYGMLSPTAPFQNELGGPILWQLVEFVSTTGDDISLDMITVTSKSSDSGNVLGATLGFGGLAYTPRAVAIKSDGSMITSGPTSQTGRWILVLTRMKLFNGGGTQGGLDAVKNWVADQGAGFNIIYTARIGNDEATIASNMVWINPPELAPAPQLAIQLESPSVAVISVRNAVATATYWLQSHLSVGGTNNAERAGRFEGSISGTNSVRVSTTDGAARFFTATVQ